MAGHNAAPVAERRIIAEYKPDQNINLFVTSSPKGLLGLAAGVKNPSETAAVTPAELVGRLDGILQASKDHAGEWGVWSYERADRRRVFTPWFDEQRVHVGHGEAIIDTRLHVAFGSSIVPRPIVHIEKRLRRPDTVDQGTVYEGFELVWDEGLPDNGAITGIWDTNNDKHISVSPDSGPYWGSMAHIIQKAHEALV
ncbi:MAG: hypothetical protein AAB834_03505 [Patescibacteria group bacterium]